MRAAGFWTVGGSLLMATASAQDGYRVTQENTNVSDTGGNSGPVRMARVAYIQGSASWRTDANSDWSAASTNLPLREGASVSVNSGGRTEIQFDDGSRLRLGTGTVVTLHTLYSDSNGEFTELKLNTGLASLTLVSKMSVFQVDTPLTSIKAQGPANIRIGISSGVEVAVRKGRCDCAGSQGATTLNGGDYVSMSSGSSAMQVGALPHADNWDQFNDNRDASYNQPDPYVPSSVAIMAGNLNSFGSWHANARYGHVWRPRGMYAGWRPYHDGHWVWVDPFGWTWVGAESWGWAPYHYGSWVHDGGGWGWAPGPRQQYWSPAVVSFSTYNGAVAWVPLAPTEMVYPAQISFGFRSGDWSLSFAIGGAAAYYPGGQGYVVGRPWRNGYLNRSYNVYDGNRISALYAGGYSGADNRFQPIYGRSAFAITRTTNAGFSGSGRYLSGTTVDATNFQRGHSFGAGRGAPNVFGPANVRPSRASFTSSRSFGARRPSATIMERSIVRARIPAEVSRNSRPMARSVEPSNRAATVTRVPRGGNFRPVGRSTPANLANGRGNLGRSGGIARAIPGKPVNSGPRNVRRANPTRTSNPGRTNAVRPPNAGNRNRSGGTIRKDQSAPKQQRSAPRQQRNTLQHRSAPRQQRAAPQQRSAPRQQRAATQQRSAPRQQRAASQQRSAPRQQRAASQQRSAPRQQRAAPQRRSAPRQQRSAPRQQRNAPRQRSAPQQRSAPKQQRAAPQQKRSTGGNQKRSGGGNNQRRGG
ncbi:MAG: FecR domain-containing protein [Fimbriimonas sp.]|nr:FecR domain-containing protein [Fimbriimonas sp.]